MTPTILAIICVPIFIIGLIAVIVNFVMASKSLGDLDDWIIVHLLGGVLVGIGGLGSVIALIWYIVLSIIAK